MDWSKLPDLGAVILLASAFASISRRSHTPVSRLWLTGWVMVALHFTSSIFLPSPGALGKLATIIWLASLTWAGVLFMAASVPNRAHRSSSWMMVSGFSVNTLYISILVLWPDAHLALDAAACLFGLSLLTVTVASVRTCNSSRRWLLAGLYCALSVFLLVFQNRPGNGNYLALNAILFSIYLGCCIYFVHNQRIKTTGAFITLAGFLSWALVFVLAPCVTTFYPNLHLEDEVWNLPKYVVAIGMILLLLEDQIEHNKYLALHDELTKLPNRRLFQDRLASALERARRTGSQAALLLIDLDRFKQVNDTLGHHVGDQVLQRVAGILNDRTRRSDTVARTGGDEFSIILNEAASREDAERVSRSVMRLLEQPFELNGETVQIGASVGVAVFPEDASAMESLCVMADVRMYAEKQTARNRRRVETMQPALPLPFPAVKAQT